MAAGLCGRELTLTVVILGFANYKQGDEQHHPLVMCAYLVCLAQYLLLGSVR